MLPLPLPLPLRLFFAGRWRFAKPGKNGFPQPLKGHWNWSFSLFS
jgi:hypothetical protein